MENKTSHEFYHPLSNEFMRGIADAYPQTASLISIGWSAESRDIFALIIPAGNHEEIAEDYGERKKKKERKRLGKQSEKLGFMIPGTQHAREVC